MGSEALITQRGNVVRPDLLCWGNWPEVEIELTPAEIESLFNQFHPAMPPLDVARGVKRLQKFNVSIREMARLNKGTKGWSLGTIGKVSSALNKATPLQKNTTPLQTSETVAIATLSIDL